MKINEIILESNQVNEAPEWLSRGLNRMPSSVLGVASKALGAVGASDTSQNIAGRANLSGTIKTLTNQLNKYAGSQGIWTSGLTPDDVAAFLVGKGVNIDAKDIPATQAGTVDKTVLSNILKDISMQALRSDTVTYPRTSAGAPPTAAPREWRCGRR